MATAQQLLGAAPRRTAVLVVFALAAVLAGCGGGGSSAAPVATPAPVVTPPPASPTGTLTGTAAQGAALAGITVTVKDGTGKVATATTSATGSFTVDTSGMTAPLLIQASLGTGTKLYSVSANLNTATVANITPLTDLILRSWYDVQGVATDTAFANPAGAPPPTPLQVDTIAQTVLQVMQLVLNTYSVTVTDALDLISQPFTADHRGIDLVFDNTRLTTAGGATTLVATGGGSTQTTVITHDTATMSLTANTTTVNGSNTTTSSVTTLVPVATAQSQALQDISASLAALAGVINSKGTGLTATDVISFIDPDLLDQGRNRTQFATSIASQFSQGQAIGFTVLQIKSLDTTAGLAQAVFRVTETLGDQSGQETVTFSFRKSGTGWLFYGDRRLASVGLQAEARTNQGRDTTGSGPDINVDTEPVQGVVSSVSISGSAANATLTKQTQAIVDDSGLLLDQFYYNTGPLSAPLPAAGTVYTLTLAKAAGGTDVYAIPLNAFTTEQVQITNLTGVTLADAHLGSTLPVAWTLPSTYAVSRVRANAQLISASFTCRLEPPNLLAVSATSTTLTMPTTCNGEAITQVNINLNIDGVNGERSTVIYLMY